MIKSSAPTPHYAYFSPSRVSVGWGSKQAPNSGKRSTVSPSYETRQHSVSLLACSVYVQKLDRKAIYIRVLAAMIHVHVSQPPKYLYTRMMVKARGRLPPLPQTPLHQPSANDDAFLPHLLISESVLLCHMSEQSNNPTFLAASSIVVTGGTFTQHNYVQHRSDLQSESIKSEELPSFSGAIHMLT